MRRLSVLAICLVFVATLAPAAPAAETDRQKQIAEEKAALAEKIRSAESRAKAYQQQIAAGDSRRASLEKEIGSLGSKLGQAQGRLADAEARLGIAEGDLQGLEQDITMLSGRLEHMKKRLQARTKSAYKEGGPARYLDWLLGAESFGQFFTRLYRVGKVIDQDHSRLNSVDRFSTRLRDVKTEAARKRDEIIGQRSAIESERSVIAALRSQVSGDKQKIVTELGKRRELLSDVKEEKATYLKEMARLEAESRRITALLKARQRGQVFQAGGTKKLAWPTTGSVTSSYGVRTHPVFGDSRMHTGIDIGAPSGQAVIAAESGTVVFAGAYGGYGNTVVVDHGNALATLYAHLSSIGVSSGATVQRSSRVGAVGCTGYCTGPHLHFETRINGEPRNPMEFF